MSEMPDSIHQLMLRAKFKLSDASQKDLGRLIDFGDDYEISAASIGSDLLVPAITLRSGTEAITLVFDNQGAIISLYAALGVMQMQSNLRLTQLANEAHESMGCEDFHPAMEKINEQSVGLITKIMDGLRNSSKSG